MTVKLASGDISDRNEEYVIDNWRKGSPYHKVAENLFEFRSVGLQVKLTSDELQRECNKLKKDCLTRM